MTTGNFMPNFKKGRQTTSRRRIPVLALIWKYHGKRGIYAKEKRRGTGLMAPDGLLNGLLNGNLNELTARPLRQGASSQPPG
jgi:hypothetical protein